MARDLQELLSRGQNVAYVALPAAQKGQYEFFFEQAVDRKYIDKNGNEFFVRPFHASEVGSQSQETTREEHSQIVKSAIREIENGNLQKVVVSRYIKADRNKSIGVDQLIQQLKSSYPNACVFYLRDENLGEWLGATPELLLAKSENKFYTIALAGTQKRQDDQPIVWNEKLVTEQSLVVDFIRNILSNQKVERLTISEAKNHFAGPLVHLKSDIEFQSTSNAREIADALHPTSAVCGMPRNSAKEFILNNEKHDRRIYTGYLGIDFPSGDASYYVALRCMQVFDDHYGIYVGGGITIDSDPDDEWMETEHKSRVMLQILE